VRRGEVWEWVRRGEMWEWVRSEGCVRVSEKRGGVRVGEYVSYRCLFLLYVHYHIQNIPFN
jgi:hypothetical protein